MKHFLSLVILGLVTFPIFADDKNKTTGDGVPPAESLSSDSQPPGVHPLTDGRGISPGPIASPNRLCPRILEALKPLGIGAVGATAIALPLVGRKKGWFAPSTLEGAPHIGYGIYLDIETIFERFPPDLKKLIAAYKEEKDISRRTQLVQKMVPEIALQFSGDYDENMRGRNGSDFEHGANPLEIDEYFARPRLASTFLPGASHDGGRGVCRHKAMILAKTLQALDLEAHTEYGPVQTGTMKRQGKSEPTTVLHEWVVVTLPNGRRQLIESTAESPRLSDPEEFYRNSRVLKVLGHNGERKR